MYVTVQFKSTKVINIVMIGFLLFTIYGKAFSQKDYGNGFYDHGTTSNTAYQRGVVATRDGHGANVVLAWLFDHRGSYSLLMTDATTGKSEQFYPPHPIGRDAVYASLLSSSNKYYTLFNGYFTEFDPAARKFTATKQTSPKAAMAMLEDSKSNIWAATYPRAGLVKFDPHTKTLTDYGYLNNENWAQYPKYIAADKHGWIYVGVGTTSSQIIAFNTKSKKSKALLPDDKRVVGTAYVFKSVDGNVYAKVNNDNKLPLLLLKKGKMSLSKKQQAKPQYFITGNQNLIHRTFLNGDRITNFDLLKRTLSVADKNGTISKVPINYETDGSWSLGVTTGPYSKLYGGVTFPMRLFTFDPATGKFENFEEKSQLNAITSYNNKIYSGGYPSGDLIEYDPSKQWVSLSVKSKEPNPTYLIKCSPVINRPHRVIGTKDGSTVILSGTPEYGYTGGGLLFWNLHQKKGTLLKHTDISTHHSTMSLAELTDKKILGGTTVAAGTGGEIKAGKAALYIMDIETKKILWADSLIANAKSYNDLCLSSSGIVYGFVNSNIFFAFDPSLKKIIYQKSIAKDFEQTTGEQCQRIFVKDDHNNIYVLFKKKIGRINQQTHEIETVTESPITISAGGDYLNGRIYFISESHLFSYQLK